jgi:pyridoxal phosphate enzyme (YggS family)
VAADDQHWEGLTLAERLSRVMERMDAACARSGRPAGDVGLVAVSKTFGPDAVAEAAAAGVGTFGENRVQEARQKIPLCPHGLEWHMIGHLQRNKVRDTVRLFSMIHSIDSERLMLTVNEECGSAGVVMPVLIEVNVSGERSKFGMPPAEVVGLLDRCTGLMNVEVRGLMTVPPISPDAEASRPFFARLREVRDECRQATGFELADLSMGMSGDFEVAIEEGATWVRVGSILFGGRETA